MWVRRSPGAQGFLLASGMSSPSSHQLGRRIAADFCLAAGQKHSQSTVEGWHSAWRQKDAWPKLDDCRSPGTPAQWLGGRASPAERPDRQPSSQPPARSHRLAAHGSRLRRGRGVARSVNTGQELRSPDPCRWGLGMRPGRESRGGARAGIQRGERGSTLSPEGSHGDRGDDLWPGREARGCCGWRLCGQIPICVRVYRGLCGELEKHHGAPRPNWTSNGTPARNKRPAPFPAPLI
jgi:hypothetical protein